MRQSGEDVIDLGYGNPDIPSHELVVEKLIESAQIKKNHKYIGNVVFLQKRLYENKKGKEKIYFFYGNKYE